MHKILDITPIYWHFFMIICTFRAIDRLWEHILPSNQRKLNINKYADFASCSYFVNQKTISQLAQLASANAAQQVFYGNNMGKIHFTSI